jgi:arylsulfatase A-like enzyme
VIPLRHDGHGVAVGSLMLVGRGAAALAVVTVGALTGTSDRAAERPNILWITSEDNGPFLGAYGDSRADTPNLDRLAERGTVYENAFATTPVCAPSRFTLITGLYANAAGTEHMRSSYPIPETIRFFPEYLREVGYHTTNNRKKDYNTVDRPQAWVESSETASYRTRNPGQPFFHVRNFTVTHESSLHDPIDTLTHDPEAMRIPPYHPPTEAIKTDWAHYYDQVTKLDAMVGEVLDDLEAAGEAENTVVFYFSDHGGVLGRSKRFMFESGLHVPLIVYVPPKYRDLAPDVARTDRLVSFVDFPKTVLSLAGI